MSLELTVDCRGLLCPAPIMKVAEAVRPHKGQPLFLRVTATDNDFPLDIDAWCRSAKAKLVDCSRQQDEVFLALISLHGALPQGNEAARSLSKPSAPAVAIPARQAPAFADTELQASRSGLLVLDLSGMPLQKAIRELSNEALRGAAHTVQVSSDCPGFEGALLSWVNAVQASLTSIRREGALLIAQISLQKDPPPPALVPVENALSVPPSSALSVPPSSALSVEVLPRENRLTMLLSRNDLDAVLPALIVANSAAAQGMSVEIYFALWALNLLRAERSRGNKAGFIQKMMQWMMPKGARRQQLSKMNMGGVGKGLMSYLLKKNNAMSLQELLDSAVKNGATFTVCSLSMSVLGFSEEDLLPLPNIRFGGLASFSEVARRSSINLTF